MPLQELDVSESALEASDTRVIVPDSWREEDYQNPTKYKSGQ